MSRTSTVQARIDPEIKAKAREIFQKLNISMSEAISLFLTQVARHKGIPFELESTRDLTSDEIQLNEKGLNKLREARESGVGSLPDWFNEDLRHAKIDLQQ